MERFATLASVEFRHSYFKSGLCRGLSFSASADTADQMRRAGWMFRMRAGGFSVIGTQGVFTELGLRFFVQFTDPAFFVYTHHRVEDPRNEFLYLSNAKPDLRGGGAYLHTAADAGTEPVFTTSAFNRQIEEKTLDAALLVPENFIRFSLLLDLTLNSKEVERAYIVQFSAAERLWKYFLGPRLASVEMPRIRCAARAGQNHSGAQYTFRGPVSEMLRDGSSRPVFSSETAIPLSEAPNYKISLISGVKTGSGDGKTIIDELPLPGVHSLSAALPQGTIPHSEIFLP